MCVVPLASVHSMPSPSVYSLCVVLLQVHGLAVACQVSAALDDEQAQVWLMRVFVLKFVLDPFAYLLTRQQYRRTLAGIFRCRKLGDARVGTTGEGLTAGGPRNAILFSA